MQMLLGLHGNCIALKMMHGERVLELIPVSPTGTTVELQRDLSLVYHIRLANGRIDHVSADQVFHIRDRSINGYTGDSRVRRNAQTLCLSRFAERFGVRFFRNNARPSGVLTFKEPLAQEKMREHRVHWNEQMRDRQGGTAVFDNGAEYKTIETNAKDSQFIELRKEQIAEVSRIFRVPPHMLYEMSRATYANAEHTSLEFIKFSLMGWIRRWESALNAQILGPAARRFFFKFNLDALARGDTASRTALFESGLTHGYINRNEVREILDRPPIEGGDKYTQAENIYGETNEDPEATAVEE
jgi:HK97 family phage portal protein